MEDEFQLNHMWLLVNVRLLRNFMKYLLRRFNFPYSYNLPETRFYTKKDIAKLSITEYN
jgi:hypothetical protein